MSRFGVASSSPDLQVPDEAPAQLRVKDVRGRDVVRRRLLALADLAAALCFCGVVWLAGGTLEQTLFSALALPVWSLLAKLHGLYDRDHRTLFAPTIDELPRIVWWSLGGTVLTGAFASITSGRNMALTVAAWAWLTVLVAAFVLRSAVRAAWRHVLPPERVLIVGSGALARSVQRKLSLLSGRRRVQVAALREEELVEEGDRLLAADRIVLASHVLDEAQIVRLAHICRRRGVKLSIVPPPRAIFGTAAQLDHVADLPLLEFNTWDVSRSTLVLKRAFDVAVAALAIVVLALPMALIALAVLAVDGRPILFQQRRAGLGGKPFTIRKFRTMVRDAEQQLPRLVDIAALPEPVFKLRLDPRITRLGRLLRRFSLDELPQLFNVLRGEMSLVGPRPEQIDLAERYDEDQRLRLGVKPGITGPMQIYGRGELTLEERLAVERDYIENLSLRRDLRILAMTIPAVIVGRGAY
jgi:exopolysaccharide biosynthesis polyprenyl glycosylphosphotransferase